MATSNLNIRTRLRILLVSTYKVSAYSLVLFNILQVQSLSKWRSHIQKLQESFKQLDIAIKKQDFEKFIESKEELKILQRNLQNMKIQLKELNKLLIFALGLKLFIMTPLEKISNVHNPQLRGILWLALLGFISIQSQNIWLNLKEHVDSSQDIIWRIKEFCKGPLLNYWEESMDDFEENYPKIYERISKTLNKLEKLMVIPRSLMKSLYKIYEISLKKGEKIPIDSLYSNIQNTIDKSYSKIRSSISPSFKESEEKKEFDTEEPQTIEEYSRSFRPRDTTKMNISTISKL